MGKTLGEMTPEEQVAVIKAATEQFQSWLDDNAEAIGRALSEDT